jgi:hypothetical protein
MHAPDLAVIETRPSQIASQVDNVESLTIKDAQDIYELIRRDSLEMARLKSDTDVACFTLGTQYGLPAHTFHFLMRQYSLAALELTRLLEDREVQRRRLDYVSGIQDEPQKDFYVDIEMSRAQTRIDNLDLSIRNKKAMCDAFERYRAMLVEKHGGQFTDQEYQAEEPEYWRMFFHELVNNYRKQSATGIPEGAWKSVEQWKSQKLIDFQVSHPELEDQTAQPLVN